MGLYDSNNNKKSDGQSLDIKKIFLGVIVIIALCVGVYISKSDFFNDRNSNVSKDVAKGKVDDNVNYDNLRQLLIESTKVEFSYAKLGGKVRDFHVGEKLEIDGGPYYFTKNKALLSYDYDDKISYEMQGLDQVIKAISFNCNSSVFPQSEGNASIDIISCYTDISSLENASLQNGAWNKRCYVYSFGDYYTPFNLLYTKNNAFVKVDFDKSNTPKITVLGLYSDKDRFDRSYRSCEEAQQLKSKAMQGGYKSLGEMMSK